MAENKGGKISPLINAPVTHHPFGIFDRKLVDDLLSKIKPGSSEISATDILPKPQAGDVSGTLYSAFEPGAKKMAEKETAKRQRKLFKVKQKSPTTEEVEEILSGL